MPQPSEMQLVCFMIRVLEFLGQPRFVVHIEDGLTDDDVLADTEYQMMLYTVKLRFGPHFHDLNEYDKRRVMIHEALHSIHRRIDTVMDSAGEFMHDHEHDRLFKAYHVERELMVDGLSIAMVDLPHLITAWEEECGPQADS